VKFRQTEIQGLIVVEPTVFRDERGFFMETYHQKKFAEAGIPGPFVQTNHARSIKNTLRGLHFQSPNPQGKLVRCLSGEIFDVAVDIRNGSPTLGKWFGLILSGENKLQLYVPPDFAHGYCILSDFAEATYACTDLYAPKQEGGIIWNDPVLAISWPISEPILSPKDTHFPGWTDFCRSHGTR